MSFGLSISDVVVVVQETTKAYQNWKHAPGEFNDINDHLNSLRCLLESLHRETKEANSLLNERSNNGALTIILNNCQTTVKQLRNAVATYQTLEKSRKKNWERLRFPTKRLQHLRSKLTLHISVLSAFLETILISAHGRVASSINDLPRIIQDAIDAVIAEIRAGRPHSPGLTDFGNNNGSLGRDSRRDLIRQGFSSGDTERRTGSVYFSLEDKEAAGRLEDAAFGALESEAPVRGRFEGRTGCKSGPNSKLTSSPEHPRLRRKDRIRTPQGIDSHRPPPDESKAIPTRPYIHQKPPDRPPVTAKVRDHEEQDLLFDLDSYRCRSTPSLLLKPHSNLVWLTDRASSVPPENQL